MNFLSNSFLNLFPGFQSLFSQSGNFNSSLYTSPSALTLSTASVDPFGNTLVYSAGNSASTQNYSQSSSIGLFSDPFVSGDVPAVPATPQQDKEIVMDPNQFKEKYGVTDRWRNNPNMGVTENGCDCERWSMGNDPYLFDDDGGTSQFTGLFNDKGELTHRYYNAYADSKNRVINTEFATTGQEAPGAATPEAFVTKAQMDFGKGSNKVSFKFDANGDLSQQFSGLSPMNPNGDMPRGGFQVMGPDGKPLNLTWEGFEIPLMDSYMHGNETADGTRPDRTKSDSWKKESILGGKGELAGVPVNAEGIPLDKYIQKNGSADGFKAATGKGYYATFKVKNEKGVEEEYQVFLTPSARYYGESKDPKDLNNKDYLKKGDTWSTRTGYSVKIVSNNQVPDMDGNGTHKEKADWSFDFENHPGHGDNPYLNISGRSDMTSGDHYAGMGGEKLDVIVDENGKFLADDNKAHDGYRHKQEGYTVDSLDGGPAKAVKEDLDEAAKNPSTTNLNVAGRRQDKPPGSGGGGTEVAPALKVDKALSPKAISLKTTQDNAFKTADLKVAVKADVKATATVKVDKAVAAPAVVAKAPVKLDMKAAATK